MITARYNNTSALKSSSNNKRNDISFRKFTYNGKKNWTTDESGDEQAAPQPLFHDKDKFIELAQAALEQAKQEEENKGVLQELIEALIIKTGAPMMADVIFEQFRCQDVIQKLAEDHYIEQEKRRRSLSSEDLVGSNSSDGNSNQLKEPVTTTTASQQQEHHHSNNVETMLLISEYIWRLFRLLILSSLVGLFYHYLCGLNDSTPNSLFH